MKQTSRISLSAVPWWWFLWCAVGCQALVNRAGGSWNGHEFHTYPHPAKKTPVPRDIMVDVINRFGLDVLAIHNEYNENNIAISPYGALSVLIALGEGLQGDAVREIQHAAHIPNDISIIRIGLRDIHRHLKSYFIPREGFLAGLTLNHENVTLRPEYEEILKFYGYDTPTFNNPLYPEPLPTIKPPLANIPDEASSPNPPSTTPPSIITTVPSLSEEKTIVATTISGDARELDKATETSTQSATTTTPESIMTIQPAFMIATTTKEAPTTTLEPAVTTTVTVTTSRAPETTTVLPTSMATPHAELTLGLATTSPEPVATTEAITTSLVTNKTESVTETTEPVSTSMGPVVTEPAETTQETVTSMLTPVTASLQPVTTTVKLAVSTSMISEQLTTVISTLEPVTTTLEAVTTTPESVSITLEPLGPLNTTSEPLATTSEPVTTTKTADTFQNLPPGTPVPVATVSTTLEPVATEPVITTLEPATMKPEPVTTTLDSIIMTTEPVSTILEPISTTLEPIDITTEPVSTTSKPAITDQETIVTTDESVVTTVDPAIATLEPVITTIETVVTRLIPFTTSAVVTAMKELESTLIEGEVSTLDSISTSIADAEPKTIVIVEDESEPTSTEAVTTIKSEDSEVIPVNITSSTTLIPTEPTETIQENNIDNEILTNDEDNSGLGFAGLSRRRARSQFNVIELNRWRGRHAVTPKRKIRSVVDYLMASHYDNQHSPVHFHRPFMGEELPSFLVHGKYREYRINFMKYDTVLPFVYVIYLDAVALSFPLDSSRYYLLLLLPRDETGVDKLICDLRRSGSLRPIVDNLRYGHVVATIPSFTLKGYVTLTPTFQQLGIKRVFEPRQSDFSPMTDQQGIFVKNIEQAITVNIKNYVDPNNLATNRRLEQEEPFEFKADHPFLYFVMDSELHIVLMQGKIVNPLNSRIR